MSRRKRKKYVTCSDDATNGSNRDKEKEFVYVIARLSTDIKDKISKTEQLVESNLAQRRTNRIQQIQRRERHHGAKEGAPSQRWSPVTGTFFQREQNATNGRRKGRADTGRRTARDVIAFLLVVLGARRTERGGHDTARVHHRTFFSHGQTGADGADDTENLAHARLHVTNSIQIDAI